MRERQPGLREAPLLSLLLLLLLGDQGESGPQRCPDTLYGCGSVSYGDPRIGRLRVRLG